MKYVLTNLLFLFICAGLHAQVIVKSTLETAPEKSVSHEYGFLPVGHLSFIPPLTSSTLTVKNCALS